MTGTNSTRLRAWPGLHAHVGPHGIRAGRLVHGLLALLIAAACAGCAIFGESAEPEDVDLVFEGLGPLDRDTAVERIGYLFEDFDQNTTPASVLDDAAFEIELLLRDRGFRSARVVGNLESREDQDNPTARFVLTPGPRTRVTKLQVTGIPPADRELVDQVLRAPLVEGWFSERAISAGRRAVLEYFAERGHLDAEADAPNVEFSEDGRSARVEFTFELGPAYVLRRIDFDLGDAGWPEAVPREAVDEALKDLLNKPYSARVQRAARGRIAATFGENAHPDAEVTHVDGPLDVDGVVLLYRIVPGPRVRVGTVTFEGQDNTSAGFLDKRVELEEGDWYKRSNLRASLANLSRAGIFDRVAIDLEEAEDGPDPDGVETRNVRVELEEAATREFYIEPGYGSYERLRLGVGARQKNLFGTGRILDLDLTVAELAQRADLSLIDPWLLGPDATAIATIFWNRRQEPSFLRRELGFSLGASWRLTEEWSLRGAWEYRRSDASDIQVDAPAFDEDIDVSEVTVQPGFDTRDAFDDPHRGQLSRATADLSLDAFGSQIEYLRFKLEHARFLPLGARTTLALSVRAGWIAPLGDTDDIPIQERFFNGGENSVRSFGESQLGPKDDNGEPVGGEASTNATIELRQGLVKRFQVAVFVDAGTVELDHEDIFRFDDPGFGIGLGLRYLLPIGPIRLDGALNPDPDEGESDGAIHLSVGFSF